MKATRKYFIRVRKEYIGYFEVEAKNLKEAETKAEDLLIEGTDDEICPFTDFEQYDPRDTLPYNASDEDLHFSWDLAEKWTQEDVQENPDKYQSIQSDNQDIFIQEEKS